MTQNIRDFRSRVEAKGALDLRVIRGGKLSPPESPQPYHLTIAEVLKYGSPFTGPMSAEMRGWKLRNWSKVFRGARTVLLAKVLRIPTFFGQLYLARIDGLTGRYTNYGLVGLRIVTTAGVNFLAADMNDGASDIALFDFHGLGTGAGTEAVGDTALGTELTTEYTGNVRATGTPSNPSANIYRTVATNTLDSGTPSVTEQGVFSLSAAGALWDRSVFTAIALVGANGDGIQSTYSVTFAAGS